MMTGRFIQYTTHDEWLEKRRSLIGASDVAGILGLSPYASPFSVWSDKVHGETRDATFKMDLGHRLEDVILDMFEEQTGQKAYWRQALIQHETADWASCTVDSLAFESLTSKSEDAAGVVEAKTDGHYERWSEIPDHHQLQLQWQLYVTGLERGWLAVMHGGRRFETYEIETDPTVQALMVAKVTAFKLNHIDTEEAPDTDAHQATTRSIGVLWDADTDSLIELSSDLAADVEALRGLRGQATVMKATIKEVENRIKAGLQTVEAGTVNGQVAVTWREQSRAEFTVAPSTFRVLRLPKEGKR